MYNYKKIKIFSFILFILLLSNFLLPQSLHFHSISEQYNAGNISIIESGNNDYLYSVVIQSDGKIVGAGSSDDGITEDFILVRYNSDGKLDSTFGINGIVNNQVTGVAFSVAVQGDGKLVVAVGYYQNEFAIFRFNISGTIDYSFGADGVAITPSGFKAGLNHSLLVQNDGKILITGASEYYFTTIRLNSSGSLDSTFGNNGIVTTQIPGTANSIAIQNDDKIVVTGESNDRFTTVRYNSNGILDSTFGNNGVVNTSIGISNSANSVAIQDNGKIVVSGSCFTTYGYPDFNLACYYSNGSLDSTFGTNGIVDTRIGYYYNNARSMAIQNDGRIVVTGDILFSVGPDISENWAFAVVRYNIDGTPDNTFGYNSVTTEVLGSNVYAWSSTIQSNEKIIIAGYTYRYGSNYDWTLVRFNTDGSLDNTFGVGGKVITSITGITENNPEIPSSYKLYQNYPNPFNPTTKISYSIPQTSLVSLKVYDILGNEIATLVNEEKYVGNYTVDFNGDNLSSGVYYYRLQADNFIDTKKMILLR